MELIKTKDFTEKNLVQKIYDVLTKDGIVLLPFDVGYALICTTKNALEKIIRMKKRPLGRPCVVLGNHTIFKEIISMKKAEILDNFPYPIGLIGKVRRTKVMEKLPTKLILKNKIGVFINMGNLGNEIALYLWDRGKLVYGSSANISNNGNHYLLRDVEEEIKNSSDLIIDCGKTKYGAVDPTTNKNLGSTVFDIVDKKIIRKGILFKKINIELKKMKLL
ncbi:MAG: Sua5/YciO/YrdC/YwlC family protein [Nanoarchaeota archaeon]|nr:Sua5/YciO/YrdC/YwlC family protein [Nanoarchaeota archaeon]